MINDKGSRLIMWLVLVIVVVFFAWLIIKIKNRPVLPPVVLPEINVPTERLPVERIESWPNAEGKG